jgi:hypothetical protein
MNIIYLKDTDVDIINKHNKQSKNQVVICDNGIGLIIDDSIPTELTEHFKDYIRKPYEPIMIPQEITKLQCVEQLRIDNKYNDLMTALKLDATGWDMIRWEAAAVLTRDSQMVAKLATALGMSSEDIDTFFVNASNIYL